MCTVTFLPMGAGDFMLASNRDEALSRPAALSPQPYQISGHEVFFPKDPQGKGSWIATSASHFTLVLLNGAFEAHRPHPPYRKSRGQVLLDCFAYPDASSFAARYDFSGIEPFTLLILSHKQTLQLTELRWDEATHLHVSHKDSTRPAIWSSATLYSPAVRQERQTRFAVWLSDHPSPSLETLCAFHRSLPYQGGPDTADRATVSLTAISQKEQVTNLFYEDMLSKKTFSLNDIARWPLTEALAPV